MQKYRNINFRTYIRSVLKDQDAETGMTGSSLTAMNDLVNILAVRIVSTALSLQNHTDRTRLQSRDFLTAIHLVLPPELAKHAYAEVQKATRKYKQSNA